MAEWTRTDMSYAVRVAHLTSDGGLNNDFVLNDSCGDGSSARATGPRKNTMRQNREHSLVLTIMSQVRDTIGDPFDWSENAAEIHVRRGT